MINKFLAKDIDRQFMKDVPEGFMGVKKCQSHPIPKEREVRGTRHHTRPSKWQP